MNLGRSERAFLSQLRCGMLPLRIETGRFVGEAEEQRVCIFCQLNEIEDETHFLLKCDLYEEERVSLLEDICIESFQSDNDNSSHDQ